MAEAKKTNALQKPLTPSAELAAVVGPGMLSRGEVVSKIWVYIKKNNPFVNLTPEYPITLS